MKRLKSGQMVKISDALLEIVKTNPLLQLGLHHRLLNLSQVARFLRPLIAARTKKDVQTSALLMSLSRLQTSQRDQPAKLPLFFVDNITVQSNLAILTIEKNKETHRRVTSIYTRAQNTGSYITISEGLSEITMIIDNALVGAADEVLKDRYLYRNTHAAAVSAKFSEKYAKTPGFLFSILESLYFQGLNILEVSSTTTEIIFYLDGEDVQLAFNTLYNRFRKR